MADLISNINQTIYDFGVIKQAIINKGVDVPDGTPTSRYGELIGNIQSGVAKYYIYQNGTEMNGHKITIYHKLSSTTESSESSKKDLNWIYIHNWFTSVTSTDKILCKGYSKIFISCMGDGRLIDIGTRFTYLKLTDEDGATLDGNDYTPNGNIITSLTLAEYFENTSSNTSSFGGIYSIDIPADVTEFYLKIHNVNLDSYITAIWLE